MYCVLAWFLTTCASLAVASCRHRCEAGRFRKRLEPSLNLVKGSALYLLGSGILAIILCMRFLAREETGQVDPTWQIIELLIVVFYGAEVLLLWLDASLESVEKALALLTGRFVVDALIIPSIVVSNIMDYEGQSTWFSLSFLASLRVLGLWQTYLDSIPSNTSVNLQVCNIAITSIVGIFFFGTLIRSIEGFTGDPPFHEDALTEEQMEIPRNKWTFLASVYFIFVTTSTVGYGDLCPKTIPGQLFTIVIIMGGIAGFSYVCSELMAAYQLSSTGLGEYSLKRRTRHIIITGSPSSQMVADFLNEIYHEDHAKESQDLEVVILIQSQGMLMESLRNFLKRKSNAHFKSRITVLQGSVLDPGDLMRVRLYAAWTVFVLPNLYVSDPVQDDTENIMRVMSIRRDAPRVRIVTLLHKAEHRQLVLSGGAAESDVICIDEFKLGMLGKSCQILGFATLVCNLCKTIGDEHGDVSGWEKLYSTGLGNELYEVELSIAYRNKPFSFVVMDILRRSDGGAYLIGIVEEALKLGSPATLRVNPGQSYAIRDDRRCYGIFMSSDRETIVQQIPGTPSLDLPPEQPAAKGKKGGAQAGAMPQAAQTVAMPAASAHVVAQQHQQKIAKQLNSSLFAPLPDDVLPHAVPDPIQDNLPGSADPIWSKETGTNMRSYEDMLRERAKSVAAKHVAQRLWQRRVLPKQDIEDLLSVKLPEDDPDPEFTEMDCEEDVVAEAQSLLLDMGQSSGVQSSLANTEAIAEHTAAHQFEVLRAGFMKMRTPKEPPPHVLARGGHILFCTLNSRGEKLKKGALGKRLGFEHFLKPLRSMFAEKAGQKSRPVVVLAPMIPADWYACAPFPDVYFVRGSPISPFDLSRTCFQLAHTIVVHQPGTAEGVHDPMMVDSDVIFSVRLIENQLPQTGPRPPIIVDLMFDLNHTFVPLAGEGDEAALGENKPLSLMKSMSKANMDGGAGDTGRASVGKFNFGQSQKGMPGAQSEADRIDEAMGQQMEDTFFYKQPRFACGTLFVSSTVTSLVVNTLYNQSLAMLVKELISAQFLLEPVPIECHGWTYQKFFEHLLRNRDLVSLAIVRRTDAIVPAEDDDNVPPPGASKSGWGKPGAVNHRYVQTAPSAGSRIVFDDQILCVPPNTNECALKNPIIARRSAGPMM